MIDPTPKIRELEAALAEAAAFTARIDQAVDALRAAPAANALVGAVDLRLDREAAHHHRAHEQLVAWLGEHLHPGQPVTLPWSEIEESLRGKRYSSWASRFEREWSAIPLAETARHVLDVYGPVARTLAGRQLYARLARLLWLKNTVSQRNRLRLHIGARSTIWGGRRTLDFDARRNVTEALKAIERALGWVGIETPPPTPEQVSALDSALGDGFAYHRRTLLPLGRLTTFKERVELLLEPQASEALALFLSEWHAEAA